MGGYLFRQRFPNHCDKIDVQAFCPVKSRVNGLFRRNSEKPVCRKPHQNPSQRGFRLIFQAGGPVFLLPLGLRTPLVEPGEEKRAMANKLEETSSKVT